MTVVWWILGILAVLFLVYLWLIAPAAKKPDDSALKGWLYAHRGLHDGNHQVAENSLEAFRRAVEAGYGLAWNWTCSCGGGRSVGGLPMSKSLEAGLQGWTRRLSHARTYAQLAGNTRCRTARKSRCFPRCWRWWTAKRP
ncbi:MAG: hypothetical protein ACLUE8_10005 [Lachnospiraceae bacterium]